MIVLVDTTVWSLALRRTHAPDRNRGVIRELSELVEEGRASLIGPIRQEILSGLPDSKSFERVREHLTDFDDLEIVARDYEAAAVAYNICRRKGVQGSHIDFLICAVASRCVLPIFTTDKDFINYARFLDIQLYQPREGGASKFEHRN